MENEQNNSQKLSADNGTAKMDNKKKTNKKFGLVLAIIILVGGTAGTYFYLHSLKHETTENAQIEASIYPVTPRVSGYVERVLVQDNQQVKAGDTLLILDNRDFLLKVKEAEAALQIAQSNLTVAERGVDVGKSQVYTADANVLAADANIEAAKVKLWRAENDYQRYSNLREAHSITEQQYEEALAAKQSAERQLALLQKQRDVALRQSKTSNTQSNMSTSQIGVAQATIKQREALLEEANLNLSYTVVTAKMDGQLSAVDIEPGQLVQTGQSLFNIVNTKDCWVVANFKETQMGRMKPGQEVEVKVDAIPGHTFHAKVSSFSPATGSKFALLPADNATGNFVKVVQKLPVKIVFDQADDSLLSQLKAGMNVEVDVHIN